LAPEPWPVTIIGANALALAAGGPQDPRVTIEIAKYRTQMFTKPWLDLHTFTEVRAHTLDKSTIASGGDAVASGH